MQMLSASICCVILAYFRPSGALDPQWELYSSQLGQGFHPSGRTYQTVTETYYSQPIPLKAGHMIYTKPEDTPLVMPKGKYAITSFIGDIVNDQHEAVALSEVYDHHWIAKSDLHENQLCHGGLGNYVFGIGAESRNNPTTFPPGYGYVVEEGANWSANIHLLRTQGLAGENSYRAAKECNECYYSETKGDQCSPDRNGTFSCCGEDDYEGVAYCPTKAGPLPAVKSYHLRYNVTYTREISALIALSVGTMSAPDCEAFYGVYRNDTHPSDVQSYRITLPFDSELVHAQGHIHTGALNISLSVNGEHVCTSEPFYGTQLDVPGNEKGYLVKVSPCLDGTKGTLSLKKGDELEIHSRYYVGSHDARLLYSDGTHLNVMGYMYVAYYRPDELNNTAIA